MIEIDGSHGEGGGQILRTSLTLSLVTRTPFRIVNIRAKRKRPGLLRQHMTAVSAAARIGSAATEGLSIGSETLTFIPQTIQSGVYEFAIGSAGSTMLVLQTILMPLVLASGMSTVTLDGGTHNPAAPPFDFMDLAFLPLLRSMGADVSVELIRPGFFPAGGGRVVARITGRPELGPLELESRGEIVSRCARAVVANLKYSIAEREAKAAVEELHWSFDCMQAHTLTGSIGPGNTISVIVGSENVTDVFTGFGERGVRAEEVGMKAAREAKRYINSGATVGEHLADQLMLPMALGGGGSFTTTPLSGHSTTNMEIIRRFTKRELTEEAIRNGLVRVRISGR